jgi:hypothetical protein
VVTLAGAALAARALLRAIQRPLRKLFGTEQEEKPISAKPYR